MESVKKALFLGLIALLLFAALDAIAAAGPKAATNAVIMDPAKYQTNVIQVSAAKVSNPGCNNNPKKC